MKNQFFFKLLWVFAALTAVSFTSCVGDQFDEIVPDDPATRAPALTELTCRLNGVEVTSDQLTVGLTYEFFAFYFSEYCPVPDLRIYLHDEKGSQEGIEAKQLGNGHFTARFTRPGNYRVTVYAVNTVTQDNFGKVYNVSIDEELKMQVVGPVVLGEPFGLYVNLEHPDYPNANLRLAVTELAFNDPQYTMTQVSPGYYEIVLKQPGAYRFTGSVENRGVDAAMKNFICKIDRFYRPALECVSEPMKIIPYMAKSLDGQLVEQLYSNYLRRPQEQTLMGCLIMMWYPPLEYRFCCNYQEVDHRAVSLEPLKTVDGSDSSDFISDPKIIGKEFYLFNIKASAGSEQIDMPGTDGKMSSEVCIEGESSGLLSMHYWKLFLPKDKTEIYTEDAIIMIPTDTAIINKPVNPGDIQVSFGK